MDSIVEGDITVEFNNLLKYCGNLTNDEIEFQINLMMNYVELNCLEYYNKIIVIKKDFKISNDTQKKNSVEIYLFIEDRFEPFNKFEFVENLKLLNCVRSTYIGNHSGVDTAMEGLLEYILNNKIAVENEMYQVIERLDKNKGKKEICST